MASNKIFVCDTELRCVCILDLERRSFSYLIPRGLAALSKPINTAVDGEGNLYVADSERLRVVKFDARGRYLTSITGDETFRPVAVALHNNRIHVADNKGRKVHVFDQSSCKKLFSIPANSDTNMVPPAAGSTNSQTAAAALIDTNIAAVVSNTVPPQAAAVPAEIQQSSTETNQVASGDANLYMPINLATDQEGNIYVTDAAAFRVQIYDREGHYIKTIGTHGAGFGEFARPKGIAVDRAGRLYVVDAAEQVIQVFDVKTGTILMYFGDPEGSEAPLSLPAGIAIDYDHTRYFQKYADPTFEVEYLILVTSQLRPTQVSVYGFGHRKK